MEDKGRKRIGRTLAKRGKDRRPHRQDAQGIGRAALQGCAGSWKSTSFSVATKFRWRSIALTQAFDRIVSEEQKSVGVSEEVVM
jgi:hypothetical protein